VIQDGMPYADVEDLGSSPVLIVLTVIHESVAISIVIISGEILAQLEMFQTARKRFISKKRFIN